VNGDNKITVIAAKMESAQKRREKMVKADTKALKCLNKVLSSEKGSPSDIFLYSLEDMRDSLSQ